MRECSCQRGFTSLSVSLDQTHAQQIHRAARLAKTARIYTHTPLPPSAPHVADLRANLLIRQDQHLEVFLGSNSFISTPNHCAVPSILTGLFVFLLFKPSSETENLGAWCQFSRVCVRSFILRLDVGCGTSTLPLALWNEGQRRQGARYFANLEADPRTLAVQLVSKSQLEV